jgi:hypothetical protein
VHDAEPRRHRTAVTAEIDAELTPGDNVDGEGEIYQITEK